MMYNYIFLKRQLFAKGDFCICPIRFEDRYLIMNWRNEQMYHLRQNMLLTVEQQDLYFNSTLKNMFNEKEPQQILFSFLKKDICIGYGGLVHINWENKNAEISFIMATELENSFFDLNWSIFLDLIEIVAFEELKFHKLYTYAYDLRPHLFNILKKQNYIEEARLKEHIKFSNKFIDVVINSKFNKSV